MPYVNSDEERAILKQLYEQAGTWPKAALALAEMTGHKYRINQATLNLVSRGERNSRAVTVALATAKLYTPPPRTDIRRCWKGTAEEAEQVDNWLQSGGYNSLNDYVVRTILEKHNG